MAEANLRTVLAAARGRGATAGPSDTEMEALLRILKTPGEGEENGSRAELVEPALEGEDQVLASGQAVEEAAGE